MIHHVFANRSNIGDWLAARGIQKLLEPATVREHLIDAPFLADTLTELAEAGARDLIVIGGGGLFMDYFTPFWEGLLPIAERVPLCIWGVGLCDLKSEPANADRGLLRHVAARSRLTVARDMLTWRYLDLDALPSPVICPSVAAIDHAAPGFGLLHIDNYTTVGGAAYETMVQLTDAFAEQTGRPYRSSNNRIRPDSEVDLAAALARYRAADIVVSSGLHGCVISVAMGRKVLAVSGDRKIEGFMKAVGLGDWVLETEQADRVTAWLNVLETQPSPRAAVDRARHQNAAIGAQLRALAVELASEGMPGCARL